MEYDRIIKLIAELKSFNVDTYQKGKYVDAIDEAKNWCVAEVVERSDDKIKIHFEGWSNKHDEFQPLKSKKLAPFRKYTRGYTGQKSIAYRIFNFDSNEFLKFKNLLNEEKENNFGTFMNSIDVTQIIRGRIFTFIDVYMTTTLNSNPNVGVPQIVYMLYDFLDLSINYLRYVKNNLYITEVIERYPDIFLVDLKSSIVACYPEIFITLKRIFGRDERVSAFYKVIFS